MSVRKRPNATPVAMPANRLPAGLRRHFWALPLGASLLLAVALRAPFARVALGPDEGGVAWVARQWSSGHGSLYGGQWLDRPPLLVALYRLAGTGGTLGIRGLGMIAALGVVIGAFTVGRRLGGECVGRSAALLAALLTGSLAIAAVYAPAELIASVPAVGSVAALVAAHRRGDARFLAVAGALAVTALLVKQSFLDAGLAGVAFLVARTFSDAPRKWRAWGAYSVGAATPLGAVGIWLAAAHQSVSNLLDALVGFRAHSLAVLQASSEPLLARLGGLAVPGLGSALFVLVPLAAAGIWRQRRDRVLAITFAAWLAGGLVGVLGGGSYWPHYLIQLIAPAAIGSALVLAGLRRRTRGAILATATGLAIAASTAGGIAVAADPPGATVSRVAAYVRDHARRGDSFYTLYARANLNQAVGLPTPFPYSWSLMMRARPDAHARLLRLLRSSQRPTWIVEWQAPSTWRLDPGGLIAQAVRTGYRTVENIDGRRVLLRVDHPITNGLP